MKKILLVLALVATVSVLVGCSSKKGGFDNADSASFNAANNTTDDIGNPPVPPEPTNVQ